MALKVIIRPLAEEDIDDAIFWYNKQKESLGEEFLFEFLKALKVVIINPFSFRRRYKQVRAFSLKKFPYKVFYLVDELAIHVLAVMHQKRNPKIWKRRVRKPK
jgi:plasmid stabilization system protein ParE